MDSPNIDSLYIELYCKQAVYFILCTLLQICSAYTCPVQSHATILEYSNYNQRIQIIKLQPSVNANYA